MPTESEEEIVAAAHALRSQGVDTVLVKLGARGSLLVGAGDWVLGVGFRVLPLLPLLVATAWLGAGIAPP